MFYLYNLNYENKSVFISAVTMHRYVSIYVRFGLRYDTSIQSSLYRNIAGAVYETLLIQWIERTVSKTLVTRLYEVANAERFDDCEYPVNMENG